LVFWRFVRDIYCSIPVIGNNLVTAIDWIVIWKTLKAPLSSPLVFGTTRRDTAMGKQGGERILEE